MHPGLYDSAQYFSKEDNIFVTISLSCKQHACSQIMPG
jgi:hypothetical protein